MLDTNIPNTVETLATLMHLNLGRAQARTGKVDWKMQSIAIVDQQLTVAKMTNKKCSQQDMLNHLEYQDNVTCRRKKRFPNNNNRIQQLSFFNKEKIAFHSY